MTDVSRELAQAWRRHSADDNVDDLVARLDSGNLPAVMQAGAQESPTRPALLFPGESNEWITRGELADHAARTSGWLVEQGFQAGQRVLLCGHNSSVTVTAYLAALWSGATVVLANPAYTATELAHLMTDSAATWAFAAEPAASSLRTQHPDVRTVSLDEPLPVAKAVEPHAASNTEVAMLAYTSGTTGKPKGVALTHGNLLSSIRGAMSAWRWKSDDVLVHSLPLSHQHGLGGVHATWIAGSSAVILPRFQPRELAHAIHEHHASVLFAVPSIYERLVEEVPDALTAPTLRLAVSGSAPLSPELSAKVADIMGVPPLERYGSTESGLDVSNPIDGPRIPGTVGFPLPGVEMRVVDESGNDVERGQDGEILLRGPQVFGEYWNRPEATTESFSEDGWFRTGDIGAVDTDTGHLRITGRKKELIITGGMNVYPREVELALEQHPAVSEAGVAGTPSNRWGEEVTAWVVLQDSAEPDELIEHARSQLAAYKCPKKIVIVESLPRNSMGKLQRSTLVEQDTQPAGSTALDRAVGKLWAADVP